MLQKEQKKLFGLNADFMGMLSSSLCAVHCMAVPLLSSFGLSTVGHHNHVFDFVLLALGIIFAGFSLLKDYFKHRSLLPLGVGTIGFVVLFVGITQHISMVSVLGGVLIAYSHILNYRHKSKSCAL